MGAFLSPVGRSAGDPGLARPPVAQQVEINRTLALMTRTLAEEVARERLHVAAVERRVARMGALLREIGGEAEPLVVFSDGASRPAQ
jgi:hypothetical protein